MDALTRVVQGYLKAMAGRIKETPGDYLVVDLETTGVDLAKDLIVQIGHCLVRDNRIIDNGSVVLDWHRVPLIEPAWLEERMVQTRNYVEYDKEGQPTGRRYRFTPQRLRTVGVDPPEVLRFYMEWLLELRQQGYFFIAHNGFHFDCALLERHFARLFESPFRFEDREVFDTGMVVKAFQAGLYFHPGESPRDFANRVRPLRLKGIRWALDSFCVPYFKLDEKYQMDTNDSHEACWDVRATHLLFQELLARASTPAQ
jgi:DNA polymerase III epsilon subunit-like protein